MSDNLFSRELHWGTVLLVIALAVLLLYAFVPRGGHSRIGSNEASAQGSLKAIATGQEQFKSAVTIDRDGDGIGEYGFLSELAGTRRGRCSDPVSQSSPYIPSILGKLGPKGIACKAGYCFRLYLPGADGPLEEGTAIPEVDPKLVDLHEKNYVVFAWPIQTGRTGLRFFAISALGQVFSVEPSPFSGMEEPPYGLHPLVLAWRGAPGGIRETPSPEKPWNKVG
ncbi:MAG: DUF2950 family protein [Planctomycetota bacterium]|jgi:hypothetical protein